MKRELSFTEWPLPPGVRYACSTREGGVSAAPFDSLNLGDHVGDSAQDVAENRRRFAQQIDARPVFLRQIHGSDVAVLNSTSEDGTEADACVTSERGVACTIMVADCLPVLFCSADGAVVAAAHAGWRGLVGSLDASGRSKGVLEAVFESFGCHASVEWSLFATKNIATATSVWLGPCIGPRAFEVGAEVREAFCASDAQAASQFIADDKGKYRANLQGLARQRLSRLGIEQIYGNDGSDAWCTVNNESCFFSHRRDSARLGGSGRFAAAIWKV